MLGPGKELLCLSLLVGSSLNLGVWGIVVINDDNVMFTEDFGLVSKLTDCNLIIIPLGKSPHFLVQHVKIIDVID